LFDKFQLTVYFSYIGNTMTKRELALKYLWVWLGTQYSFGGNDSLEGFDCSGIVIEVLQSVGILPHKFDDTAHGLYLKYKDNLVEGDDIRPGCLVFWFRDGRARHVMMIHSHGYVIGACGGGKETKTKKDAIRDDAFVKMRPISYNGDSYKVYDPFKGE